VQDWNVFSTSVRPLARQLAEEIKAFDPRIVAESTGSYLGLYFASRRKLICLLRPTQNALKLGHWGPPDQSDGFPEPEVRIYADATPYYSVIRERVRRFASRSRP
jgi:hypothetical protein